MVNCVFDVIERNKKTLAEACEAVDHVCFFDSKNERVCFIAADSLKERNYDDLVTVTRISDFAALGRVYFANIDDFMETYQNNEIRKYIQGAHLSQFWTNPHMYVAAYVYLYRLYKSFDTLVVNDHSELIDSFIEYAIDNDVEQPGTFAYLKKTDAYKALRLRKAVYEMFSIYFNEYRFYDHILTLQNSYSYSDREFRELRNKIRNTLCFDYELPKEREYTLSGLKIVA